MAIREKRRRYARGREARKVGRKIASGRSFWPVVAAMPKGGKGKKGKGKGKKGPALPSPLLLPKEIREAASNGEIEVVQAWLDGGGKVDATHSNPAYPDRDRTLLMIASRKGMASFVAYLLQRGAAVNRQDSNGCTALMFAALHGKPAVVRTLLMTGADPRISNNLGEGPMQWAQGNEHEDCVRAIKDHMLRDDRMGVEQRLLIENGGVYSPTSVIKLSATSRLQPSPA